MTTPVTPIKVIAIAQERRGHGLSTATYFMARAIGAQHVPVLVADLTSRPARLNDLASHFKAPLVVPWQAPAPWLRDVPGMLTRLRQEVQGKIRCVLVDAELGVLAHAQTAPNGQGLDYLLIATESSPEGQQVAERVAERFERLRERQRIGVCFTRINPQEIEDLPSETNGGLPVLGFWPADYRLANSDDYSSSSAGLAEPQAAYQAAITRLTTRLMRMAGVR